MSDLVSVIIPVYNAEKYLTKCLNSIIGQTYENIEIILINDGSTDSTGEICSRFAAKDSRIRYIEQENAGQSITRNRGIGLSKGRYIYFMDSDDHLDDGYIEFAVKSLKDEKADMMISNYYHELENGASWNEREFEEGVFDLTKEADRYKFIVNVFLPYKCGFEVWNRLYDAELIKENGLEFPVFKPVVAEDVCFNLLYIFCAGKIIVSNKRFYHYLHNDSSTMAKNAGVQINRYNEVSRLAYSFLENKGKLPYLRENYVFIHLLLIYHELMNYDLKGMKAIIKQIEDKENFRRLDKLRARDFAPAVKNIGIARTLKYSMLGILYGIWL
ncbi:glycosyltransferase family 2 protein [Lachnospiraceae bacterium C1.1]|nr:glycosyltransferase family 2 protein [Lachnospiraceae bacterium C1.1]